VPLKSKLRLPFTLLNVRRAPADRGVYALWESDELIYFGLALGGKVTIRSSLKDHRLGLFGSCTARATHFSWEICRTPLRRETELLREHRAHHEAPPRCNKKALGRLD
jgi:hypothetical protein